jgi:uroporphyrinogen decarboxylase
MVLKSRERVFKALNHEEPDRIPLDEIFRLDVWDALKKYFSVDDVEDVRRFLGIDFRHLSIEVSEEFRKKARFVYPFGYYRAVEGGLLEDEWSIRYSISSNGRYLKICYHPLANADVGDIDSYEFPPLDVAGRFEKTEERARMFKDLYILEGVMEQTLFEWAWHLRGFNKFILDLYTNEKFVNKLLDKLMKYKIEMGKRFIDIEVDIIRLGDDVGSQKGMLIPPHIWRKYFKPRMKIIIDALKSYSRNSIYIFYHSDGYIEPIIPDLIEIGVQILNPVQPECMNPAEIKRKYGDKLILHGTISVQRTIPFGTVEDVRKEVISRIKECGRNGGLVIAPAHTPQPDMPIENILAVYETTQRFCLRT